MAVFRKFNGDINAFSYSSVLDSQGKAHTISGFWKQKTAILVYLRHFGCIACRAHAQDVWQHRETLERNGSRIYFIGNGEPKYIEIFRNEFKLGDAPIYTDPRLAAFAAAGFRHGIVHLVSPKSAINMGKLTLAGHKNGNPLNSAFGSNRQMGGVIVVHPGTRVTYHYISEALGDVPNATDIPDGEGTASGGSSGSQAA